MGFMYLAVEDELSEEVGIRIIKGVLGSGFAFKTLRKNGFGYLKSKIESFIEMSQYYPVLMITDLDKEACAPKLKEKWFKSLEKPERFIFRIAVREIESWVLADTDDFAAYLGVRPSLLPKNPDALLDPKATLINIAKKAKKPLRLDIVPEQGAIAVQGLGYNRALCQFIREQWDCQRAASRSESLSRACTRVAELRSN
ncbi:hypothetical protein [Shinella sp. BYT-45]|uniref:hypothetical protein n=1 Tax=Shinella sp. BYT-45 TaxID=3377377 RepID=UPI00397F28E1